MKVIALRGEPNIGKTKTLNIVYRRLMADGFKQIPSMFQDLGHEDILDILKKDNFTVGIATQGDYAVGNAKGDYTVKNHLETLNLHGCDIAVCAATLGQGKDRIMKAIEQYPDHIFIEKTPCYNLATKEASNTKFAQEVIGEVMKSMKKG